MLTLGVIGCGYWGPNLVRNFYSQPDTRVTKVADLSRERLQHMETLFPALETTQDHRELIEDPGLDAIVISTPVTTHYKLAKEALEAGKHVFLEKPLTHNAAESLELVKLAEAKGLVGMVGHTFLYSPAVMKIKELVDAGELGEVQYISTIRVNLGLFQDDINVVWDLAPHDISIFNFIFGSVPDRVNAVGHDYIQPEIEDVAFLTFRYPKGKLAHVHVSWLDPNKIRKTTVVGSKKMLVYDDVSTLEKIRVYDKGVDVHRHYDTFGEFHLAYRFGDISIPKLADGEPLKAETAHFLDCIRKGTPCRSSFLHGHQVVVALEHACRSMGDSGGETAIDYGL
ncbi:MAG: Gfo/Idh/MocA family oxidoreductase [Candidatus Krumholzibacteriota bacterium]|nr:Gfo/Idh/MocA family oxidoreductase [Candidatus Krumholzibacteriota bacterium]